MENNIEEKWKYIDGYNNLYQISNKGRVKSFNYGREVIRSFGKSNSGYLYVILSINGKGKTLPIHRLVAKYFIENKENLPCVNHKDENRTNNDYSNLEWCTYSYNNTYKEVHLKRNTDNTNRMIIQYDLDMKEIKRWINLISIEKELGLQGSNIIKCCKYERNHSGKFKWRYYQ